MKLVKVIPNSIPIKNNTQKGYLEAKEGDGVDISSRMHHHRGNVQKDKTQTLTTTGGGRKGCNNQKWNLKKSVCSKE